jgi:hypothetical protein
VTDEEWTPVYEKVEPHAMCCESCKAMRERIAKLEAALRKYGTHKPTCAKLKPPGLGRPTEFTGQVCDCGFDAALAGDGGGA